MKNLKGKTAFITGGSKGIGFGIARELSGAGVNVAITGRNKETIAAAAGELNKNNRGGKVIGIPADVRDFSAQQQAVETAVKEFGGVDIVIANAGVGHFASVEDLTAEQWQETIDTNLSGPFYSLKAGLKELKKNKGYFIVISSLAGTNFFKNGSAYNASKFGVTGFTQAAMLDLRAYGIKTTVIMPGSVSTYFNDNIPDAKDSWKIQSEDIGKIVIDLLTMHERTLPSKIEVRPTIPPAG